MADPITNHPSTFHHLLAVSDGEILVNELFNSKRELAESFVAGLRDGSYDIGIHAEEAAAADYPEGVNPPAPGDALGYLDALSELLRADGIDLHIDAISAPEPSE